MEEFELFIKYSESVRYMSIRAPIPIRFFEKYRFLLPARPYFPQLRSLAWDMNLKDGLQLLHSGVISLHISHYNYCGDESEQEADLVANSLQERTPNLIRMRDVVSMLSRGRSSPSSTLAVLEFQRSMHRVLPRWTHLRHLDINRLLRDFPAFFTAVSQLPKLSYLKIAIARCEDDDYDGAIRVEVELARDAIHNAEELKVEGEIEDLHLGLALCSPGTRLTRVSLEYYIYTSSFSEQEIHAREYFILPTTLSLVPITEFRVTVQDNGEDMLSDPPAWAVPSSAFSTLTTSRCNLFKIDIRILYCTAIILPFLDLIAKLSPCLEQFVILRSEYQEDRIFQFPSITLVDVTRFALALPKLHHLGLDMDTRPGCYMGGSRMDPKTPDHTNELIQSNLKILEVGASPINEVSAVAKHLRYHFPMLENLGWEGGYEGIWNPAEKDAESDASCRWTDKFGFRWRRVCDILGCTRKRRGH